jgi:hypothetical protein
LKSDIYLVPYLQQYSDLYPDTNELPFTITLQVKLYTWKSERCPLGQIILCSSCKQCVEMRYNNYGTQVFAINFKIIGYSDWIHIEFPVTAASEYFLYPDLCVTGLRENNSCIYLNNKKNIRCYDDLSHYSPFALSTVVSRPSTRYFYVKSLSTIYL